VLPQCLNTPLPRLVRDLLRSELRSEILSVARSLDDGSSAAGGVRRDRGDTGVIEDVLSSHSKRSTEAWSVIFEVKVEQGKIADYRPVTVCDLHSLGL